MRDGNRFDDRGYLVRLVFGRKPQVFELPGAVESKAWKFARGVAVRNQSLSVALDEVARLMTPQCETEEEG